MIIINEEQVDIKTPEFVSLQYKLAGLGSRGAAIIIDQILLTIAMVLIILSLFFFTGTFAGTESSIPFVITIIAIFILNYGYFFIAEYFFDGKTIGKQMIGIRVIQENGHGITLLSSFIRNLLRIIDMLPSSYFVGMIMVFFHSKHKRLGDLAAGTIVVHERKAKGKMKQTPIEKEIALRGLTEDSLDLEAWAWRALGVKEWKLVQTYADRLLQLPTIESRELTTQMATLLFPKIGLEIQDKTNEELENTLLVLYLKLRNEWEFEL